VLRESGLTNEKMEVLKARTVTLFPDNDGYKLWKDAQKNLPSGIKFTKISDLLERKAKADELGYDLADYLTGVKKLTPSTPCEKTFAIAGKVVQSEEQQTKQQIIEAIRKETNVSIDRATKGFEMMVRDGAILPTLNPDLFYLHSSTPF
jgi:hypothetical protein